MILLRGWVKCGGRKSGKDEVDEKDLSTWWESNLIAYFPVIKLSRVELICRGRSKFPEGRANLPVAETGRTNCRTKW